MIALSSAKITLLPSSVQSRIWILVVAHAALAASVFVSPGLTGMLGAALALLMIAIASIDARYFIIPNELTTASLLLALLNIAVSGSHFLPALLAAGTRAFVMGILFIVIRRMYAWLRGKDGLGLGDVKLATVAGAWLDLSTLPVVIEVAALTALGYVMVRHMVCRRKLCLSTRIPFGLFFAPSIWLCWFLQTLLM
jgi:leader peptidase (prepilin peptidase) / N-methyltransferase